MLMNPTRRKKKTMKPHVFMKKANTVITRKFKYSQTFVNDHPWNPPKVAVVDWWSLPRGVFLCFKHGKWDLKEVVVVVMWSLF
jgi:hypothetical protein